MDFSAVTEQPNWDELDTSEEIYKLENNLDHNVDYLNFKHNNTSNLSNADGWNFQNESEECAHVDSHTNYTPDHYILLVSLPIIILVGTIGNVLSIVVLRRRVMQMSAASFYLIILAFSDLSILYFSALKTWIRMVFGFELMHTSNALCKILKYIFFTSGHLSSWLVVAITVERLVVVRFPFKASRFCSYRQSVRITCIICVVIMLLNLNVIGASKLVLRPCNRVYCSTYLYSPYLYSTYNLSVYSLIPFVLVLSMNMMTILSIMKNNKLFKQHHQRSSDLQTQISSISKAHRPPPPEEAQNSSSSSKEQEISGAGSAICSNNKDSTTTAPVPTKKNPIGRMRWGPRHLVQQQRRLTCTLLTITVLWLLLTGPYAIMEVLDLNGRHFPFILRVITYLLMYVNHAINFYIYCLTGRKFRSELRRAFCREWKPAAYRKVPFKQSIPPPCPIPAIRQKVPGGTANPNGTVPPVEKKPEAPPTNSGANSDTYKNGHCKTTKL